MTHSVIVFDGVCVLCNGWVRFLLSRDRANRYKFASMQSEVGRKLLVDNGLDPDDPVSFLLLEAGRPYSDSNAIIRVLQSLGGVWSLAVIFKVVPNALRDRAYRALARNRYRLFGKHEACLVPAADVADRFL